MMDYEAEWERIHAVLFKYFQCGGVLYEEVVPDILGRPLIEGVPTISKKYFELKKQVEHYKKIAEARQGEFSELRKRLKVPESEWVTPYVRDALDELDKAKRALERAGFVDNGAQEWKPPIGWGKTGYLSERLREATEKLAKSQVDCDKYKAEWKAAQSTFEETYTAFTEANKRANELEAELSALRQRDAVPVDPDAWEMPLELTAPNKHRIKIHGDDDAISIENTAYMVNTTVGVVLDPADAARASLWLASYAAAHGCPVAVPEKRDAVPVKVRWAVSDERIQTLIELGTFVRFDLDKVALLRETFAQHAVIDAPAGVPSVDRLWDIFESTRIHAAVNLLGVPNLHGIAAVRDVVLAGVWSQDWEAKYKRRDAEYLKCHAEMQRQGTRVLELEAQMKTSPIPTPEQIEALARVLHENRHGGLTWVQARSERCIDARAAFAHIGRVPVCWELDIEPDRTYEAGSSGIYFSDQSDIDWLRSRIKPIYECKECSDLQLELDHVKTNLAECEHRIDLAKSALEGE